MDKSSLIGLILGFIAVFVGMILKGAKLAALNNPAAFLIIIVGTIAAVMISFPMNELKKIPKLFKIIFNEQKLPNISELIPIFSEWAVIARKEGLLALESKTQEIEDPFLNHGMKMVIDGQPPEVVRDLLEEEVDAMEDRHAVGASIFTLAGTYAPTLGVLGAVVGLIAALGDMSDMEKLGHAISAAFIATLLGIFTGYVLWHPFANKLKRKSQQEALIKRVMIEGILAIQEGASPRVIEDKLATYVPESERQLEDMAASAKAGEAVNG